MTGRRKPVRPISGREYCQIFTPSQSYYTPRVGFRPAKRSGVINEVV